MGNTPRRKSGRASTVYDENEARRNEVLAAIERVMLEGAEEAAKTLVQVSLEGPDAIKGGREQVSASVYILDRLLGKPKTREQNDDTTAGTERFLAKLAELRERAVSPGLPLDSPESLESISDDDLDSFD